MEESKENESVPAAPVPGHGLTPEQYEECMRINDRWPQTGDRDGWVLEHNAIRLDMRDYARALATCIEQGGNLTPWQVDILQSNWSRFNAQIHTHHGIEEKLFFPFMNTKVKLPPKMSADHTTLLQMLDRVTVNEQIARLSGGGNKLDALRDAQTAFTTMRENMVEHLAEEEAIGLPMLRHHFSEAEVKPIIDQIVKTLTPRDVAWLLRQFETEEEKRHMLIHELFVPGFVASFIMMPAVRKFHAEWVIPFQTLIAGATQAPPQGGGCVIL